MITQALLTFTLTALGVLTPPTGSSWSPLPNAPDQAIEVGPSGTRSEDESIEGLTVEVPAFLNETCPIMGKPASKKLHVDTELGRIYVCCAPCIKRIRQDIQRAFEAAYPTVNKVDNTICPVTRHSIEENAPVITAQGMEIKVCCDECKASAVKVVQLTLIRASHPNVREIGNQTCPVSGEPIVDNALVLIGDNLIRLSSLKHVAEIEKAPAAVLKRAKLIAKEEAAASQDRNVEHACTESAKCDAPGLEGRAGENR